MSAKRCDVCGRVDACPGNPPPNVLVDPKDGLIIAAVSHSQTELTMEENWISLPDSDLPWCRYHYESTPGGYVVHAPRDGHWHVHVRKSELEALEVHGWPKPLQLSQKDYVIVYRDETQPTTRHCCKKSSDRERGQTTQDDDTILEIIAAAGEAGMTASEIRTGLSRNIPQLGKILERLLSQGLLFAEQERPSRGRPSIRYYWQATQGGRDNG